MIDRKNLRVIQGGKIQKPPEDYRVTRHPTLQKLLDVLWRIEVARSYNACNTDYSLPWTVVARSKYVDEELTEAANILSQVCQEWV